VDAVSPNLPWLVLRDASHGRFLFSFHNFRSFHGISSVRRRRLILQMLWHLFGGFSFCFYPPLLLVSTFLTGYFFSIPVSLTIFASPNNSFFLFCNRRPRYRVILFLVAWLFLILCGDRHLFLTAETSCVCFFFFVLALRFRLECPHWFFDVYETLFFSFEVFLCPRRFSLTVRVPFCFGAPETGFYLFSPIRPLYSPFPPHSLISPSYSFSLSPAPPLSVYIL